MGWPSSESPNAASTSHKVVSRTGRSSCPSPSRSTSWWIESRIGFNASRLPTGSSRRQGRRQPSRPKDRRSDRQSRSDPPRPGGSFDGFTMPAHTGRDQAGQRRLQTRRRSEMMEQIGWVLPIRRHRFQCDRCGPVRSAGGARLPAHWHGSVRGQAFPGLLTSM